MSEKLPGTFFGLSGNERSEHLSYIYISIFKCFKRWRVEGVSWWYVGVVSWRCDGVGRGGGWSGGMCAWGVRWARLGVGGAWVWRGRACCAISVGIARSALLSGYLGKSGHLPRSNSNAMMIRHPTLDLLTLLFVFVEFSTTNCSSGTTK